MLFYKFLLATDADNLMGVLYVLLAFLIMGFMFWMLMMGTKLNSKQHKKIKLEKTAAPEPELIPETPKIKYSKYKDEDMVIGAVKNGVILRTTKGEFVRNHLPEALKTDWDNPAALGGLCALCISNGIIDEIDNAIKHLVEIDPDKPRANFLRSDYLIAQGKAEEAITDLKNLLSSDSVANSKEFNKAPIYLALYNAYMALNDETNAFDNLDKSLRIEANPVRTLFKHFEYIKNTKGEESHFEELKRVSEYEGSFFAQLQLARIYFAKQDVLSAMKTFDSILPLPPQHASWLGEIGAILNSNNCSKLAYTYYTKYYDTKLGAGVGSVFVKSMINLEMIEEAEATIHQLMLLPNANFNDLNILTNLSFELDSLKIRIHNENVGELLPVRPLSATYDKPQWMLALDGYDFFNTLEPKDPDRKILIMPFSSSVITLPNGKLDYIGFEIARQLQFYIQDSIFLRSNITALFETQFDDANHRQLMLDEPLSDEVVTTVLENDNSIYSCIWGEVYIEKDTASIVVYLQNTDDADKKTITIETSFSNFDSALEDLLSGIMEYLPADFSHEPFLQQFKPTLTYFNCLNVMHSQKVNSAGIMKLELASMTRRAMLNLFNVINNSAHLNYFIDLTLLDYMLLGILLNDKASGSEIYKEFELDVRNTFANPLLSERYGKVIGDLYGYNHPNAIPSDEYEAEDSKIHNELMSSIKVLEEIDLLRQSIELDKKYNLNISKPVVPNIIEATYSMPPWVLALSDLDIIDDYKFEPSDYKIKILSFSTSKSTNTNGTPDYVGYGLSREFSILIHEALYLYSKADVILSLKVDEANKKIVNNDTPVEDSEIDKLLSANSDVDCYIWGDVQLTGDNIHLVVNTRETGAETVQYTMDSTMKTLGDDLVKFIRDFTLKFNLRNAANFKYPISNPMPFYLYSTFIGFIFRQNAFASGMTTHVMHGETRSRIKDLLTWIKYDNPKEHQDLLTRLLLSILITDKNCGNHIYEEYFSEVIQTIKDPVFLDCVNKIYY